MTGLGLVWRRVPVTAAHIAAGVARSPSHCPVALALREATGLETGVGFDIRYYDAKGYPFIRHAAMSAAADRFISNFDTGKTVRPTTFRFQVPG